MALRTLLFDFDGTLADSFDAITASVNHVRAYHGLEPLSGDTVKSYVGWGLPHLMNVIVPHVPIDDAVQQYRMHHTSVIEEGTRLFPGVMHTLTALRQRNYFLGVCSNKAVHFTRVLLGLLGIKDLFDIVMGPEDVDGRAKPLPDMLLSALQRLGVEPAEALYIGDMSIDIETARAAGVPVWVLPTGPQSAEHLLNLRPDRLLESFPDVLRYLPVE